MDGAARHEKGGSDRAVPPEFYPSPTYDDIDSKAAPAHAARPHGLGNNLASQAAKASLSESDAADSAASGVGVSLCYRSGNPVEARDIAAVGRCDVYVYWFWAAGGGVSARRVDREAAVGC